MSDKPLLYNTMFLLFIMSQAESKKLSSGPRCFIGHKDYITSAEYFQDGDFIIGGILSVHYHLEDLMEPNDIIPICSLCMIPYPAFYKFVLAFIFAIDEINKNPNILPNVTLGYHIIDPCNNVNKAILSLFKILSGPRYVIPNYSHQGSDRLAGIIGDHNVRTSSFIGHIVNIYRYTQITYRATDPLLSNGKIFPSLFQILPRSQILAIITLLKHFEWTWIGVVASDDEAGDSLSQELKKAAAIHGICIEFIIVIPELTILKEKDYLVKSMQTLLKSTSTIMVLCGTPSVPALRPLHTICRTKAKTLIIPAGPIVSILIAFRLKDSLDGSIMFDTPSKNVSPLRRFIEDVSLENRPGDLLLQSIFSYHLKCVTSNTFLNLLEKFYLKNCSKSLKLSHLQNNLYQSYLLTTTVQIYRAVYALAQSLHEMQLYRSKYDNSDTNRNLRNIYKFLGKVNFQDPTGEKIAFSEKNEMTSVFIIKCYKPIITKHFVMKHIGKYNSTAPDGQKLLLNKVPPYWKYGEVPVSKCSADCPPGYRRVVNNKLHKCCFDCLPCLEGEISNDTAKGSCQKCPEDQWPNDNNQCAPKPVEFLSYQSDFITIVISSISVFFFIIASIILIIFIIYRDTPIVKANNQNLSFCLLASIMLSFLSVFLFMGHPLHITCMFRQTSFGIIFSLVVSCILAKVVLVYLAFKATKPGCIWRNLISAKLSSSVVIIGTFMQVLISTVWLSVSPPFPESNNHIYQDKIIVLCNEGSMLAFYVSLAYIGLLAMVSFLFAFMSRNLPDRFNEAKNITFSMLVVCSVWVSFIPAHLNVTGKNTVLVEIFAILSSSFGVLSFIFFPKCYTVLFRPDINFKSSLLR